ncbi:flavin monooxygenase-like protein [Dactylonectria macrodidyma]|uniref:Flavin monooxygenase-like protein n=1 Tax=Dactylonectria macrodidyma TaxID=307937 RepID=A0A9P9ESL6_9HYPO|nr:flavin monooxygenase-like protein [Dactylonectria macrodidyma]
MGIVAVKNLREEGFDVTGFERSAHVGGLWRFTEDDNTLSVLETTVVNVAIDRGCYTDFPFRKGTPPFCSARQVHEYLESYVDHFELRPFLRLNTVVKHVAREEESNKWRLDFEFAPSEYFEKVVIATGPHYEPVMPTIQGSRLFAGRLIHSKAFKRPDSFVGQKVIILGLGNTGNDIAEELVGKASRVSIAHNHGAVVLPRDMDRITKTKGLTYRFSLLVGFIETWYPSYSEYLFNKKAKFIMEKAFGKPDPSWCLDPAPSIKVVNPVMSDTLIARLRAGDIHSIPGIKQILGPKEVELQDGKIVEADAIICCTGYKYGFDLLDTEVNPAAEKSSAWLGATGSKGRPLPRLYQNVFSLKTPDSLAFLGCVWFVTSAFSLADIASMCIAQVWAGHAKLPAQPEMEEWMSRQEKRISSLAQRGTVIPASVPARDWLIWADKTAGMGVEEHLGWGWTGWLFWLKQRALWKMLMDGPQTAAVWRLFDGRRKKWDGARAEIERANASNVDDDKNKHD